MSGPGALKAGMVGFGSPTNAQTETVLAVSPSRCPSSNRLFKGFSDAMMVEDPEEDSPFAPSMSSHRQAGARLFTRHATCLPRLEHSGINQSGRIPSSPELEEASFVLGSKMENKDTNKANPVFGARAGLAKPPRLPFPTGKSGSVSHWNQRSNIPTGPLKPAAKATLKVAPSTLTGFGSAVPKPNPVVQKKRDRAMDMDMDMQDASECSGSASESTLSRNRPHNSKFGDNADSLLGSSPLDSRLMDSPPMEKIRKTSAMDCGETTEHLLPCSETCRDALKRITPETLADVLEGKYQTVFEEYVIIDCRYPYEYAGGHIRGAQNVNTTAVLESKFFPIPTCKPRVVIFHCEFSAQRAPRMGLHLRNHDRNVNISEYPYLDYPQMYILEGGYEAFHKKFQGHCSPDGYIAMNDPAYKKELEQCSALQKREFKRCYSTGFFRT